MKWWYNWREARRKHYEDGQRIKQQLRDLQDACERLLRQMTGAGKGEG